MQLTPIFSPFAYQPNEEHKQESDLYEHIQDENTPHDAQTMDVASADEKPVDVEENMDVDDGDDDVAPEADKEEKVNIY